MQFRCPNCQHPIRVGEEDDFALGEPIDAIECPSCHSRFSLSSDAETTVVLRDGIRIGHFEVLSLLGEGSFGTVYKARDLELKRDVALKIPREGRVTKDTARMFLREAQAAAAIQNSNVISVYEVGMHNDQYYIATQYIDGITLAEYLRTHSMAVPDAVRMLIKLLRAVQVFHDKGIVHRDLKPGNILLNGDSEPFVADFGLARHDNPNDLTVTQGGKIVGTLHYMSPEQARGDQRSITARSDLYAMGVLLYQLLTGERPFQATTSQTLLYSILHDEPRAPRRVNASVPRDLNTVCLKAMEKRPDLRYASASEMADDLQRYLDGKPVLAKPVSTGTRLLKWVSRNIVLSVAIAVAAVSLAGVVFAVLAKPKMTPDARPTNAVSVVLSTDPPVHEIVFTQYDKALRVPDQSGFTVTGRDSEPVSLLPGLYQVLASTADGKRFHEVWRTVPEDPGARPAEQRFPHLTFEGSKTGVAVLPSFHLFSDSEIADPLVTIEGGTFEMGYQVPGELAGRHQHSLPGFSIGIHEISYGRFRKVLNRPIPKAGGKLTWLESFDSQYGDRSEISDEQPVTGYPIDVAILYCELAGCRLPTNAEYEYVATRRGTARFPTGETAVVSSENEWTVLSVRGVTPDVSDEGIRNLYSSVAEYTDSNAVAYNILYPQNFALPRAVSLGAETLDIIIRLHEVRGAPQSWVLHGEPSNQFDVRQRIPLNPLPLTDADTAQTLNRIGWRVYRSAR